MNTLYIKRSSEHADLPAIRRVEFLRPLIWLGRGWIDFVQCWGISLGYGAVFALLGDLLVNFAWSWPYLALPLTPGFLFVGPFLATVFYVISRRLVHGRHFRGPLEPVRALRRNPNIGSIALFSLLLIFILSAWTWLSDLLLALFLRHLIVTGRAVALELLFQPQHLHFMLLFFLFGGLMAALVFAVSVVALPMLIARKVDVFTAIVTSLWVVWENPLPMLLWAILIGALTFLGQLLWFVPLAVIFPVLGYASWHVYRDTVDSRR